MVQKFRFGPVSRWRGWELTLCISNIRENKGLAKAENLPMARGVLKTRARCTDAVSPILESMRGKGLVLLEAGDFSHLPLRGKLGWMTPTPGWP